ncbi:RsmE family RNA methyltransferase [Pseudomonadota bacterium]
MIGPEGGFSESERNLIGELGLSSFSLGPRILRMETAAVLSLGLASLITD